MAHLSDEEREAFQEIFDLLIPDNFRIFGYNKKKLQEQIMKIVEDDVAVMRLKMRKIYRILDRLT